MLFPWIDKISKPEVIIILREEESSDMLSESAVAFPLLLVEKLVTSAFVRKCRIFCRIVQDIKILVAGTGGFQVENYRPWRVTVVIVDESDRCMFCTHPGPVRAKVLQTAKRRQESFVTLLVFLFNLIKDSLDARIRVQFFGVLEKSDVSIEIDASFLNEVG